MSILLKASSSAVCPQSLMFCFQILAGYQPRVQAQQRGATEDGVANPKPPLFLTPVSNVAYFWCAAFLLCEPIRSSFARNANPKVHRKVHSPCRREHEAEGVECGDPPGSPTRRNLFRAAYAAAAVAACGGADVHHGPIPRGAGPRPRPLPCTQSP